ncbi:MAG: PIN domain-containing protein [Ruminococcus sp.]|jgi:predicted nucleic acid-binding protein|nr:PIN domain-containing protein [Ruminococcus sp.]
MGTPRIYLDTSVISHLDQPEKPIQQEYSLRLWDAIIAGEYEVWLSDVVYDEVNECSPEKRKRLNNFIDRIKHTDFILTPETEALARHIIDIKILPSRCEDDSMHIAAAIMANCEFLLSWNLKHLANITTSEKVRLIAIEEFKHELAIIEPSYLLEGVNNERENFTAKT